MPQVAYLGDTACPGAASYLCGIMTYHGVSFTYTDSSTPPSQEIFNRNTCLYILSDYESSMFSQQSMEQLCSRVADGAGLIMLGGWESYHGLGGDWDTTPLAELLPVKIMPTDDRRNCSQLMLVRKNHGHQILDGLPWHTPPGFGGYNLFAPKEQTELLLEGERYHINTEAEEAAFTSVEKVPLLVTMQAEEGTAGSGRRACLATDVAPHWVGGWVDWGDERVTVKMGDDSIEVGSWYMEFFGNLIRWGMGDR